MKKFKKFILINLIIFSFFNIDPVFAEENINEDSIYEATNNMDFTEKVIYDEEGNEYVLVNNDNLVLLYDESGEIRGRIFFTTIIHGTQLTDFIPVTSLLALIDDYDKWHGWNPVKTSRLQIDVDWNLSRTILKEAIKAIIKKEFNLIEVLQDYVIDRILDLRLSIATVSLEYNQNKYCSILRKERSAVGNGFSTEIIDWTGNPWDFTGSVESACRTLTERYW